MLCTDCQEDIISPERRDVVVCKGCSASLHNECAMWNEEEDGLCEGCFFADSQATFEAMNGFKPPGKVSKVYRQKREAYVRVPQEAPRQTLGGEHPNRRARGEDWPERRDETVYFE